MTKHSPSDFGSPFARQHGSFVFEEVDAKKVGKLRVRNQTPFALDQYYKRNRLDKDAQANRRLFEAGNRYRDDFQRAGLQPDVVSRYDEMVADGSVAAFFDGQVDALHAWRDASRKIGIVAYDVVVDCCCFGRSVGKLKMEILRRGLWQLVKHYGY